MKCFSIIIATFFLSALDKAYSQPDRYIHLVMAYVDYDERIYGDRYYPPEPEYLKILFRLESDSLVVVDTLNSASGLKMNLLMNYPEQKLIYFEESRIDGGWTPDFYSMLSYGDSLVLVRFRPEWDTSFFKPKRSQLMIEKNGKYLMYNEWDLKGRLDYDDYARDFYFNKYRLGPSDFQNPVIPGGPGMQRAYPMGFALKYIDDSLDKLRISKGDKPVAQIQLPDSLKDKSNRYFYIALNNEKYCAGKGLGINENDSSVVIKIFDKERDEWHSLRIKGNSPKIMNWDDWLYGTVEYSFPDEKTRIEIYNKYNGRYSQFFGKSHYLSRHPGILYLYHVPSRKYIEWDTGDPDSEIVFMCNDRMYYRVFDELRAVAIDPKRIVIDWDSDKLVVKDRKIVPNIHWMFFAPKATVREVWIDAKGN